MKRTLLVDYIIVGQGLAGSAIAIQLMKRQKRFLLIDEPNPNSATRIAAGLFNPVTGKKLVKTWLADIIFPYLHQFYKEVEEITGRKLLYSLPVYRPFISIEEQNEWMGRSADANYQNFIDEIFTAPAFNKVHNPLGGVMLKQCGYIDTLALIEGVKTRITSSNTLWEDAFNYDELVIHDNSVSYREVEASCIIFCEGVNVSSNPWFNRLPIRPLKGETLSIKCSLENQRILNRGVYVVPGQWGNEYRVGATYNLHDRTPAATMPGKLELEEKLGELITVPYEITAHSWGFRPTTTDRRPILGKHPQFDRLIIFNGLGTKGVSLAPYFSEQLIQLSENATPLYKEVDVARYKLLY